jgi:hypothetical protein
MIEFISKALNWVCACIGAIVAGTIGYSALCGDFGDMPKKILAIAIGVVAIIGFVEIGIGLNKAKTTDLFGDED